MGKPRVKSKYARRESDAWQFKKDVSVQIANKTSFMEHSLGARKKLFVHGDMVSTTKGSGNLELNGLSKKEFMQFFARFSKQLYKRFRSINSLYDIDIKFNESSRGRNDLVWSKMPEGQTFYNIDFKSAYWQIGYKLGYINEKMFNDYMYDDNYKSAKRYCFSFLARKNFMTYYANGKQTVIDCQTDVLKKVYENVRHQLYTEVLLVKNKCKKVVEWNIDGICVASDEFDLAAKSFKEAGILYKITVCKKIDEYTYQSGSKVKNFKKKPAFRLVSV